MMYSLITNLPTYQSPRILLRPLQKSDAGLLEMYSGDARVAKATKSMPHPLPPGAVDAYIARSADEDRKDDIWVMDGSGVGLASFTGIIWLTRMDRDQSEVTFWVAPAFWNTGLASEALAALIAANPHQAKTMFAEVFNDNPASARLLANAGFKYLGDAEAFSVARNATVPTWTYVKNLGD